MGLGGCLYVQFEGCCAWRWLVGAATALSLFVYLFAKGMFVSDLRLPPSVYGLLVCLWHPQCAPGWLQEIGIGWPDLTDG